MPIIPLDCPGCGEPAALQDKRCRCCGRELVISTFNSVMNRPDVELQNSARRYQKALRDNPDTPELQSSLAYCFLKLRLFDRARAAFEKAMEEDFDASDNYFWAAVCLMQGKRPFLVSRELIDRALKYLEIASSIESKGVYRLFKSFILYDHFERKGLNHSPSYREELLAAKASGYPSADVEAFLSCFNDALTLPDALR